MDRRRILLVVAALVAALGAVMVFLYVQSADNRAEERFETREVLVATQQIEAGESVADALANAKLAKQAVPQGAIIPGALDTTEPIAESVALTTILAGEQIVPQKFGATAEDQSRLTITEEGNVAMSINLTDPARVAGFVNPGSDVAILFQGADVQTGQPTAKILLTKVKVIAVGSTTPVTTTTTTPGGQGEQDQQVVESLPRTLLTLSVSQKQMERVLLAQSAGSLSFALLDEESNIRQSPGTTYADLFQS